MQDRFKKNCGELQFRFASGRVYEFSFVLKSAVRSVVVVIHTLMYLLAYTVNVKCFRHAKFNVMSDQ